MFELAVIALIVYLCYKSRVFELTVRFSLGVLGLFTFYVMWKVGFLGPWFLALIDIPILFFKALFNLVTALI